MTANCQNKARVGEEEEIPTNVYILSLLFCDLGSLGVCRVIFQDEVDQLEAWKSGQGFDAIKRLGSLPVQLKIAHPRSSTSR